MLLVQCRYRKTTIIRRKKEEKEQTRRPYSTKYI